MGSRWLIKFEPLSVLGHGSVGVVYKARQINTGRIVALKVLSDRALQHRQIPSEVSLQKFKEEYQTSYWRCELVRGRQTRHVHPLGIICPASAP